MNLYVVTAVAFILILLNAFYGHLLFTGPEQVEKYSIYVHLQPEWKSHPNNLIFEVTNRWIGEGAEDASPIHNTNQVGNIDGREYVELKHGFSDCTGGWHPALYSSIIQYIRHWIEYMYGEETSTDPGRSIYPNVSNTKYDDAGMIKNGYIQFIPLCTSSDQTSYSYSIRSEVGFSVYFVQSADAGIDMQHVCAAENMISFSGRCSGIKAGGGMLVAVPDDLSSPVTRIIINVYEHA